ncbi:hypothetical protein C8Q80DRAFT_849164 [Daedaleopsis nitida]|nr:hypothetical protein C8Q80DRAFT_849164 [Daedaleopsis nitida]
MKHGTLIVNTGRMMQQKGVGVKVWKEIKNCSKRCASTRANKRGGDGGQASNGPSVNNDRARAKGKSSPILLLLVTSS